ncbi:putative nuclease HARBI1 [Watersipora subatra]|uniref:putative nuclease HARBI1 n=1 Tax=Watersipora subatra TaxID=2589382 RepID=UPI00355BBFA5
MSPERFEHLLSLVSPHMKERRCRSREVISHKERLALTIRYLATGDSQQSQSFNFRIGRSTVCKIIKEVCQAIWDGLYSKYLCTPKSKEEWATIGEQFTEKWHFPNVLGAIDGKHIMIDCPKFGGSLYYNYKHFHSTVLLEMCDANYLFTYVSIGSFGRDNDAAIFSQSSFFNSFIDAKHDLPSAKSVNGTLLPYTLLGDDIFPLKPWLMKPYPGRILTQDQKVYNYRLSASRRTIENSFGIMSARWRIFRRPIRASIETVDKIVQACVCLHNYLNLTDNATYIPAGFVDSYDSTGNVVPGDWREVKQTALVNLDRIAGPNYTTNAKLVREQFKNYLNSPEGSLSWQVEYVNSCGKRLD